MGRSRRDWSGFVSGGRIDCVVVVGGGGGVIFQGDGADERSGLREGRQMPACIRHSGQRAVNVRGLGEVGGGQRCVVGLGDLGGNSVENILA